MHGNAVRGHFVRSMLLFLMTQNRSYSRVRRARQAMLLEEWASAESLSWGLEPLGRQVVIQATCSLQCPSLSCISW